jgi:energy-coupling factor transporter ATP-binding protein EcfA2
MSVGLSLLRRIIDDGGPLTLTTDLNVSELDFTGVERDVYNCVVEHVTRYSVTPSVETVFNLTSVVLPEIPPEPLQFWVDQIKNRSLAFRIRDELASASDLLQAGNYELLVSRLQGLGVSLLDANDTFRQDTLLELAKKIIELHDERQLSTNSDTLNVPFGFQYLDHVADGLQQGDTVGLTGETGVGKSYVLCRMAKACHDAGRVPLVVSMEMSSIQMARRTLALRTGVNEQRIRRGELSTLLGRQTLVNDIAQQEESGVPFYLLDGSLVFKIEDLTLYIKSLRPDAVYIDGAYLLKTKGNFDGKWAAVAETAEQVKILARQANIPIVGTYQINDRKEIFGAKSVKHLASIVLMLENSIDTQGRLAWGAAQHRTITITKGRFGEYGKIRLIYDMVATRIEEIDVLHGHSPVEPEQEEED